MSEFLGKDPEVLYERLRKAAEDVDNAIHEAVEAYCEFSEVEDQYIRRDVHPFERLDEERKFSTMLERRGWALRSLDKCLRAYANASTEAKRHYQAHQGAYFEQALIEDTARAEGPAPS